METSPEPKIISSICTDDVNTQTEILHHWSLEVTGRWWRCDGEDESSVSHIYITVCSLYCCQEGMWLLSVCVGVFVMNKPLMKEMQTFWERKENQSSPSKKPKPVSLY